MNLQILFPSKLLSRGILLSLAACALTTATSNATVFFPYVADADTLVLYHFDEASGSYSNFGSQGASFDLNNNGGATGRSGSTTGGFVASGAVGFGNAFSPLHSGNGFFSGNTATADGGGAFASGATSATQADYQAASGALTWEAVISTATLSGYQAILSRDNGSSNRGPDLVINGDLNFGGAETVLPTSGAHAFAANELFHVAVVYDGEEGVTDNLKFYWTRLDAGATEANLIASATLSADFDAGSTGKLMVGGNGRGEFRNELRGLIDEERVSAVARAADEFIFVPVAPVAPFAPYTADVATLILYHFDEASGSFVNSGTTGASFDLDSNGGTIGRSGTASGGYAAPAVAGFGNAFSPVQSGNGLYNSATVADGGGAFATSSTSATQANYQAPSGALTWEAMVWLTALNKFQLILSRDNGNSNRGPSLFINTDLNFGGVETDIPFTGPHAFVPNEWFHVAVTYDGEGGVTDNVKFYWTRVDAGASEANLIGTATLSEDFSSSSVGELMVGSNARGEFRNEFDGLIDEVRISNVARRADEFIFSPSSERVVSVHYAFSSQMVLQRDRNNPIWGRGRPGDVQDIKLNGVSVATATVDVDGDWTTTIPSQPADNGTPHTLTLELDGEVQISLSNVIFGDVYLATGQSNMEWGMNQTLGYASFSNDTNPNIRQMQVERATANVLQYEPGIKHEWESVTPDTIGRFTGVGYHFARNIYAQTGVPVGLINASYGGQRINRFVNPEGMELVPELAGELYAQQQGQISNLYQIYNAMIGPLAPYGLSGVLYYQGETDRSVPELYGFKMLALIRGYRAAWGIADLPVWYCQLPNFNSASYTLIREGQLSALSEPNAGMAVLIDVGDDTDIHPTNKQDPGARLSKWALAQQFGQNIPYSGPIINETIIEGSSIRVLFDYAENGLFVGQKSGFDPVLEIPGGPLENFEIAGSDLNFVPAGASIDSDTVVVSAASVTSPQYVRYCFSDAPAGGNKLYNHAGLPASPFRSDLTFDLTVVSGTGSINPAAAGSAQTISANSPSSGTVFDRWVGVTPYLGDVNSATTSLTMPAHDVNVNATYRSTSTSAQSISVDGGIGGGTAQAGTYIDISADAAPAGMIFDQWVGDISHLADSTQARTLVRVPNGSVFLLATYVSKPIEPHPSIVQFGASQSGWQLNFTTHTGQNYRLQTKSELTDLSWTDLIYNIKGDGFDVDLSGDLESEPTRFFRVGTR